MPNTELLRDDFINELLNDGFTEDEIIKILWAFDKASQNYNITHKSTDLITLEGMPEAVKWFLASKAVENCSEKTLHQYKYKLFNFFTTVQKQLDAINTNDIRLYLYWYKTNHNVSNHTLDHTRLVLNAFFTWCIKNDVLTKNPMEKIEKIKFQQPQRTPLTPYELELLRWSCTAVREKALIDILFSTGCRVSECAAIQLSDINWEERSIVIQHGKGDKQRTVYFNAEAELSLRKYLETRNDDCEGLFVSTRKPVHSISAHALENIVKAVGERAGIRAFPHKIRHTFATYGLNGGMSLDKLQKLLGHAKPETTLIYAKLDQVELQHEHRRIYQ